VTNQITAITTSLEQSKQAKLDAEAQLADTIAKNNS